MLVLASIMLVYACGQNHDARLVALLARLMLIWLVKKPVRYIPSLNLHVVTHDQFKD